MRYHVEPAERCGLPDRSATLVTAGQALHWFDFSRFYAEARRVLRLGGNITIASPNKQSGRQGEPRVNGGLAVTRSLGDRPFKPYTTAEPHTVILRLPRTAAAASASAAAGDTTGDRADNNVLGPGDEHDGSSPRAFEGPQQPEAGLSFEFLVVATDGLWDAMSSDEVVAYVKARRQMSSNTPSNAPSPSPTPPPPMSWQGVATALTHEALLRLSSDNVGVCVVDLATDLAHA